MFHLSNGFIDEAPAFRLFRNTAVERFFPLFFLDPPKSRSLIFLSFFDFAVGALAWDIGGFLYISVVRFLADASIGILYILIIADRRQISHSISSSSALIPKNLLF
ncbi:hypothetical protein BL07016 [Bacillus licheniformis DSM 13 = ATCC 14580]|uniref:Uncharacterized protein n=1 Tax=Bacillus licheniformis (strain ATCC 14580 / DSM 13 / JCM 2505 / CCUG 7422 / NBRC 12200 / NCIMB 9375 / NCTC 10341 / NRRL NRS-1264 / Gibson 46) TaxID=279010 RepID=Q65L80_BACLD|nr:hypothetical protein BL07016 [Bacillus licheniformis DSM 13 = ATCC 14580]